MIRFKGQTTTISLCFHAASFARQWVSLDSDLVEMASTSLSKHIEHMQSEAILRIFWPG